MLSQICSLTQESCKFLFYFIFHFFFNYYFFFHMYFDVIECSFLLFKLAVCGYSSIQSGSPRRSWWPSQTRPACIDVGRAHCQFCQLRQVFRIGNFTIAAFFFKIFFYLFIYLLIYLFLILFYIISYFNLSQVKGIGNHTAVAIQMNCRNFPILFKRCPEIKVRVATTDDVECIFSTARAKRRIHTAVTVLS